MSADCVFSRRLAVVRFVAHPTITVRTWACKRCGTTQSDGWRPLRLRFPRQRAGEKQRPALPARMTTTTLARPCPQPARNPSPPTSAAQTQWIWMRWSSWSNAYSIATESVVRSFVAISIATVRRYWCAASVVACLAMPSCFCAVVRKLRDCIRCLSHLSAAAAGWVLPCCRRPNNTRYAVVARACGLKSKWEIRWQSGCMKAWATSDLHAGKIITKTAPMRGGTRKG